MGVETLNLYLEKRQVMKKSLLMVEKNIFVVYHFFVDIDVCDLWSDYKWCLFLVFFDIIKYIRRVIFNHFCRFIKSKFD